MDTTTPNTPVITDEYKEVLAFLADAAERGIYLPFPSSYTTGHRLDFFFSGYETPHWYALDAEQRQAATLAMFRAAVKGIGGRWKKNDPAASTYDDSYYIVDQETHRFSGGAHIRLYMSRDVICDRVETGEYETKVTPAVKAQPERVEQVPVYARECKPLNAAADKALEDAIAEVTA